MAKSSSYQYLDLAKPTIPYRSYTSPVDEEPHFIQGSQNVLGTQIGYLEKRPGFSTALESVVTAIPGTVVRLFAWRRWGGSFFVMACAIGTGATKVYKYEVGSDDSFSLIWTSTGFTGTPFDFVVSDNFCFFGDGTDMRKYDGTTVSKWGCDAPITAPSIALENGTLPPGMTYNSTTNTLSGTPTADGTSQITINVTDSAGNETSKTFEFTVIEPIVTITNPPMLPSGVVGTSYSELITHTFGGGLASFSVVSGTLPPGLSLPLNTITGTPSAHGEYTFAIQVHDSSGTTVKAFTLYIADTSAPVLSPTTLPDGLVGASYSVPITASGVTAPYSFTYINSSDTIPDAFATLPPGLSLNVASPVVTITGVPSAPGNYEFNIVTTDATGLFSVTPFSLTVQSSSLAIVDQSLPTARRTFGFSVAFTIFGGAAPYTSVAIAGALNAQSGYVYGYSYTTQYGHESNVSPLSNSTGLFTNLDVAVTMLESADPQVNGINLYRSSDGGAQDPSIMRLVAALTNTTQTYVDSTPDESLGTQTGPAFLANTPPTPCIGFVWSNGRIYGFVTNTTYYSGAEEISNGIQEEAWPSGLDGNYYAWPSEVGGMGVTPNGVDIGLSEQFWQVSGDTLDTFRKTLLLDKAGTRSPTCINSVGNDVQWIDTAQQIWSSSLGEIGEPIRADLTTLDPLQAFIGYHKSKNFNWIYVLDALNSLLYVYDLDLNQWNTPWTVAATAIYSGEISLGQIGLIAAFGGKVMILTPGTYLDNGVTYEDDLKMGLLAISPGRMTSGRSKIEPTQIEQVEFEMNAINRKPAVMPTFVGQLTDDDPVIASQVDYIDLTSTYTTPQFIPPGQYLIQMRYIADSITAPAIRVSEWIRFSAGSIGWRIYSITLSWISS